MVSCPDTYSKGATVSETDTPPGPLSGLVVLDLSRILAGPTATQILGDLGAEVIKIERPGRGDDTRGWGPPFLKDEDGEETAESAYYLSSNRNKKSVAVDLADPQGQRLISDLADKADILIENFKVGDLRRRGLDYETLKARNPSLIYCSISGFGQTGPYAHRAGYDFLIQGMGGIMSLTGFPDEEGGTQTKCGVGIADVMCGMYAVTSILAALHHRNANGEGQYIDISLLDSQVSWLINQGVGLSRLRQGSGPPRQRPSDHRALRDPFRALTSPFILAVGNDSQFRQVLRGCRGTGTGGRSALCDAMPTGCATGKQLDPGHPPPHHRERPPPSGSQTFWKQAGVPCGPVNDLQARCSTDPQVKARVT